MIQMDLESNERSLIYKSVIPWNYIYPATITLLWVPLSEESWSSDDHANLQLPWGLGPHIQKGDINYHTPYL